MSATSRGRARIAVAGHSLGAVTTLGTAFNGCCVDRRIDAGIVMAGGAAFFPPEQVSVKLEVVEQ